jgi:hypothetical protein
MMVGRPHIVNPRTVDARRRKILEMKTSGEEKACAKKKSRARKSPA